MRSGTVLRAVSMALLLILTGTLAAFAPVNSHPPAHAQDQTNFARVRFANASVDAPLLDAYIDDQLWFSGLNGVVGYLDLNPGTHVVSFRETGGSVELARVPLEAAAGQRITLAALNTVSSLDVLPLVDDVSAPARNAARMRVVHAAPAAGAITVTLGPKTLATGLAYGETGTTRQFFAGDYDLTVTDAASTPLLTQRGLSLTGSRAYTLFLIGTPDGTLRTLLAESTVLTPPANTHFRFAHMARNVGPLSVYVNQEPAPLYASVPFGRVTNYLITGPGEHLFEVFADGTGPDGTPLASAAAEIGPDETAIFVIQGDDTALDFQVYTGSLAPLPGGMTRLQVINTLPDAPTISVTRADGLPLLDGVATNTSAARDMPGGLYNLRLQDAENTRLFERYGLDLPAGTLNVLIAFDVTPGDGLLSVIPFSTDYVPQHTALRCAHLHPMVDPVDIYLDDTRIWAGAAFGDVSEYTLQAPRAYTLRVFPAGSDPTQAAPLAERVLDLGFNTFARTVYLYGETDRVALEAAPDSFALLPTDVAQVRFIHAAPGVADVVAINLSDGRRLIEPLLFGFSSVAVQIPAGAHTISFVRAGTALAAAENVAFLPGHYYTIALTGTAPDALRTVVTAYRP